MILSLKEIQEKIRKLQGWNLESNSITKTFEFKDFKLALYFVNKVGELAESENHHPDIFLHNYKKVDITLSTHAIGGLSSNDFIMAAKINNLELLHGRLRP